MGRWAVMNLCPRRGRSEPAACAGWGHIRRHKECGFCYTHLVWLYFLFDRQYAIFFLSDVFSQLLFASGCCCSSSTCKMLWRCSVGFLSGDGPDADTLLTCLCFRNRIVRWFLLCAWDQCHAGGWALRLVPHILPRSSMFMKTDLMGHVELDMVQHKTAKPHFSGLLSPKEYNGIHLTAQTAAVHHVSNQQTRTVELRWGNHQVGAKAKICCKVIKPACQFSLSQICCLIRRTDKHEPHTWAQRRELPLSRLPLGVAPVIACRYW